MSKLVRGRWSHHHRQQDPERTERSRLGVSRGLTGQVPSTHSGGGEALSGDGTHGCTSMYLTMRMLLTV